MDNQFIVSARKYRPQNFDTVVGQSHITTTLKNAIKNNQLAHAFLFCGPRGVGKTTCARILAKTINCQTPTPDGEACNACNTCVAFDAGTSMNIHELDAASNNSVDDIRNLVEQVRFAPQAGKYKVYIVDEVHMLSNSAFNAFLKTLEEPPSYAIFILATTEKHKILPTILSRCQIFDFKRMATNDTVAHLQSIVKKENIHADKAALQIIAEKSEGCMRDSLSILDKIVSFTNGDVSYQNTLEHLNILDDDYYFRLIDFLLKQDLGGAMLLYDEINRKGFEGDLVINYFSEFIRNLLVCKDAKAAQLLDVVEGKNEKYRTTAAQMDTGYLIATLHILNEAAINFRNTLNKRLHVEMTLIKLNFLQQAIELSLDGTTVTTKKNNHPLAIKFQTIAPIRLVKKNPSEGAKFYIETSDTTTRTLEPPQQILHPTANESIPNVIVKEGVSLLDSLRNEFDKISTTTSIVPKVLDINSLQQHWKDYILTLRNANKATQANVFERAQLNLINELTFSITILSTVEQKFIEQEKSFLIDYLQRMYHNRKISFTIIQNTDNAEKGNAAPMLSSREKFEQLAAQYPLLNELKNRLKLQIEY